MRSRRRSIPGSIIIIFFFGCECIVYELPYNMYKVTLPHTQPEQPEMVEKTMNSPRRSKVHIHQKHLINVCTPSPSLTVVAGPVISVCTMLVPWDIVMQNQQPRWCGPLARHCWSLVFWFAIFPSTTTDYVLLRSPYPWIWRHRRSSELVHRGVRIRNAPISLHYQAWMAS